ncbi:MAG: hypothetical protein ACREXX_14000 [Gammaproteobacteria bacterium]
MSAPVCFVDTETDGVHPGRKPWELAIIRRTDTGEDTYHAYVEIDLSTADPFGLRVGRFYERHPLGIYLASSGTESGYPLPYPDGDAPTYVSATVAAAVVARVTHGAHIVGAVPNFDTETLAVLLREHELTPAWHYHLIDVETLAVGYLEGLTPGANHPGRDLPWDSEALSRACGVEPPGEDERHTALGDARWAMRLYDAITGDAS